MPPERPEQLEGRCGSNQDEPREVQLTGGVGEGTRDLERCYWWWYYLV